jgi:hypothetical protein
MLNDDLLRCGQGCLPIDCDPNYIRLDIQITLSELFKEYILTLGLFDHLFCLIFGLCRRKAPRNTSS